MEENGEAQGQGRKEQSERGTNGPGAKAQAAVWALTAGGAELGEKIARGLGFELFLPERLSGPGPGFSSLKDALSERFGDFRAHVIVAATGLVVRIIAPLIKDKKTDPAVVTLGQDGRFAVSLL
ncbi:MAG: hypothetical protein LBF38_09975, partial [Deltaproteobacteria bacterium]|nr:hypothetical protein [Deltaproteobacteria bacterium]